MIQGRQSELILKQTVRHNCALISVGLSDQVMVEYHMRTRWKTS